MPAGANPSYYRKLAVFLGIGVVVAVVLGLLGITGPGLFYTESAIVALFIAIFVLAVVLTFFLVRVGDIFSIEDKLKLMLNAEGEKWSASLKSEEAKAEELRQALRREAAKVNQDVLKESASQRMRIDDANTAAVRAANEAQSALAQIAELRRRPEVSAEVTGVRNQLAMTDKELAELKRRDNVNSPLLKELQEQVRALQAELKKMSNRLGEALDVAEKREMEAAANRSSLDKEVTDLRKRETLMTVKQKPPRSRASRSATARRRSTSSCSRASATSTPPASTPSASSASRSSSRRAPPTWPRRSRSSRASSRSGKAWAACSRSVASALRPPSCWPASASARSRSLPRRTRSTSA
jgi:low affinity Fe/Cu permease